jgi:hypothetical protein
VDKGECGISIAVRFEAPSQEVEGVVGLGYRVRCPSVGGLTGGNTDLVLECEDTEDGDDLAGSQPRRLFGTGDLARCRLAQRCHEGVFATAEIPRERCRQRRRLDDESVIGDDVRVVAQTTDRISALQGGPQVSVQRVQWCLAFASLADDPGGFILVISESVQDQVVFAGEVREQRAFGDLRGRGDLSDRHPVIAALHKQRDRGLGDGAVRAQFLALPQPRRCLHPMSLHRVELCTEYTYTSGVGTSREFQETEVIVVGAGPTGLVLAGELALAGVAVDVIERQAVPRGQSRGGGINPRTAQVLAMRGLLDAVTQRAMPRHSAGWHFAGLPVPLDARPWRTRYPDGVLVPQDQLEEVLEDHLRGLGVAVRRSTELIGMAGDDACVADASAGESWRTHWSLPGRVRWPGAGDIASPGAGDRR